MADNLNSNILNNALQKNDTPNLLIYRENGEKYFHKLIQNKYNLNNKIIKNNDITYTINELFYEFDLKNISLKHFNKLLEIIKEIIQSYNYHNSKKIILFKNFNNIKIPIQNVLRVIIEKYRKTTLFICFTNNYNSIISPLRSRFLFIKFPYKTNKEKRMLIYNNSNNIKLQQTKYYDFIYSINSKKDIINIINYDKEIIKFENIYDIIFKKIFKIYNKNLNKNNFDNLKNISYNILKYNIDVTQFYISFIEFCITNPKIRDKTKYKIIKLLANSQYNYANSYRSSIILESLLINIYALIKPDLIY